MTFAIRAAEPRDLSAILALERAVASAPHWSEDTYAAMLVSTDTEALQETEVLRHQLLVAEAGDSLVGFAAGKALRLPGEVQTELENVVVSAAARRQGIGRRLCEGILDWARGLQAHSMTLEVRASNGEAIGLYQSLNFQQLGTRKAYYLHPVEDAVLMSCELPRVAQAEPYNDR